MGHGSANVPRGLWLLLLDFAAPCAHEPARVQARNKPRPGNQSRDNRFNASRKVSSFFAKQNRTTR